MKTTYFKTTSHIYRSGDKKKLVREFNKINTIKRERERERERECICGGYSSPPPSLKWNFYAPITSTTAT